MSRFLAVLAIAVTGAANADDKPEFKFTTKREKDRVGVKVEKDRTVFDVHSPFGISEITIERTAEAWPEVVVVRLHLASLEHFKLTGGQLALGASVADYTKRDPVSLWVEDKKDSPRDEKSPYWLDFRMIGKGGKATEMLPLEDGYFEMRVPKPFLKGKSFTLDFIDFYRK